MNKYEEKAQRIRKHLETHPRDYQSVISLLKNQSYGIAYEIQKHANNEQRKIAEARRIFYEKYKQQ